MKKIYPWEVSDLAGNEDERGFNQTIWEEVTEFDDEGYGWVRTCDGWGFVNRDGYLVIPDEYDLILYPHFQNGFCIAVKEGKYGVFDRQNNAVIPFIYDHLMVKFISENPLFAAALEGKWGIIDRDQKEIIPFQYDWITSFNGDYITARLNGKYGAINYMQKTVIDFTWAHLEIVEENFAAGKTVDVFFDKNKLAETDVYYSEYFKHFTQEFQKIVFGVIDINQKVIYPFVSDSVVREFNPANGRAKISLNYWEHEDSGLEELCFVADAEGKRIPFIPTVAGEETNDAFHKRCHELIWGEETWPY